MRLIRVWNKEQEAEIKEEERLGIAFYQSLAIMHCVNALDIVVYGQRQWRQSGDSLPVDRYGIVYLIRPVQALFESHHGFGTVMLTPHTKVVVSEA